MKASATKRAYRQETRAQQSEATAREIITATIRLVRSLRRVSEVTLEDIARESGLTARTILRRFGSRDGVLEAAFVQLGHEVKAARTGAGSATSLGRRWRLYVPLGGSTGSRRYTPPPTFTYGSCCGGI